MIQLRQELLIQRLHQAPKGKPTKSPWKYSEIAFANTFFGSLFLINSNQEREVLTTKSLSINKNRTKGTL